MPQVSKTVSGPLSVASQQGWPARKSRSSSVSTPSTTVTGNAVQKNGLSCSVPDDAFCTAFPVTVVGGVLTLDDQDFRAGQPCCESTEKGPLTVFDTCGMELRHVLGAAGVSRLRRLARRRRAPARS